MESSGVILQQTPCFSSYYSRNLKEIKPSSGSVLFGRRATRISGFQDDGHMLYYSSSKIKCSYDPCSSIATNGMNMAKSDGQVRDSLMVSAMDKGNTKSKLKKQLKVLKGLSKGLSTFSEMYFGLDSDQVQDKANVISDAAEILRKRIEKLKAEEKELKRKKKEEKARMKAEKCEKSSSSSSESSDSECGEVVDMKSLKNCAKTSQMASQTVLEQEISPPLSSDTTAITLSMQETSTCCIESRNVSIVPSLDDTKKIEVCMGGKCKKSGAAALLQEFERAVGIEGAVSGCKCMGKCRDGPNVRVLNGGGAAVDSVRTPMANPLCIGVGLEDIDMIVANFLGEADGLKQPLSYAT